MTPGSPPWRGCPHLAGPSKEVDSCSCPGPHRGAATGTLPTAPSALPGSPRRDQPPPGPQTQQPTVPALQGPQGACVAGAGLPSHLGHELAPPCCPGRLLRGLQGGAGAPCCVWRGQGQGLGPEQPQGRLAPCCVQPGGHHGSSCPPFPREAQPHSCPPPPASSPPPSRKPSRGHLLLLRIPLCGRQGLGCPLRPCPLWHRVS